MHKTIQLPEKISATDIETLIRNPYGFYARKILKLKQQLNVSSPLSSAEFGSFIHKVIEIYSQNYSKQTGKKEDYFCDIAKDLLETSNIPAASKKIWQMKINAMKNAWVGFDEERRAAAKIIYSELAGQITLELAGQKTNIEARVDRIEMDKEGKILIYDYKTGEIASKKEVEAALSPQLIISALIASENGFNLENFHKENISPISVNYIKISARTPYFKLHSMICLSQEDLELHKQGLQRLLNYYFVETGNFAIKLDIANYNNYKHLSRLI